MTRRLRGRLPVIVGLVLAASGGCEIGGPEERARPPVIDGYAPRTPLLTAALGDSLFFSLSARDPSKRPLSYRFTIADSVVTTSDHWTYGVDRLGDVDVSGRVSNGIHESAIRWRIHRVVPDSVAPAEVPMVSAGPGREPGDVTLEWTAVGDDGMSGLPAAYILRASTSPIVDEPTWSSSAAFPGRPEPVPPGETMSVTWHGLPPAGLLYLAVRAVDDYGLVSPLPPCTSARARGVGISGVVREAVDGTPVGNIEARLQSASDTTAAEGSFALADLTENESVMTVRDEPAPHEIGDYFDVVISPYRAADGDVVEVWLLPNAALDTREYPHFLSFYKSMTAPSGCYGNVLARWVLPCRVHVPPLVEDGLDYRMEIQEAFREWEALIGLDTFEFVDAVPDTGLFVEYTRPEGRDYYIVTERAEDGQPVQGRISLRTGYSQGLEEFMRYVIRHEIGHALGLNHSLDHRHIMGVGGQVAHPSADEARLIRAVYRIPRGFPAAWYVND